MFHIELLIGAGELEDQGIMERNRKAMDDAAQGHPGGSSFVKEEILPYVVKIRRDQKTIEVQDETTAGYCVLKRHYE
jgi:hypothetical protein